MKSYNENKKIKLNHNKSPKEKKLLLLLLRCNELYSISDGWVHDEDAVLDAWTFEEEAAVVDAASGLLSVVALVLLVVLVVLEVDVGLKYEVAW